MDEITSSLNIDKRQASCQDLLDVQKTYGGDERVQAAAITIQRSFREHQIRERFRMITEQLRQTGQSAALNAKHDDDDEKKLSQHQHHHHHHNDSDGDGEQRSSSSSSSSSSDKNSSTDSVPFVSGTTRVAISESLSQAANYLAASAAATLANRKQTTAMTNGVAKSASCQQVANFATSLHHTNHPVVETMPGNASINNNSERTQAQLNSGSVVATAINFQQLESIRKRQYRVGLNIFNTNPAKGISFFIAYSFIDCSPPYIRNSSTSYYLSNQLHFIDKQRLAAHQQSIHRLSKTSPADTITNNPPNLTGISLAKSNQQPSLSCRLCQEEENLKRNIAHFLFRRKGLAKEKIGEYLGNLQSKFIQDVLVYYLQKFDFSGLQIDVALRKFSAALRMPGEAQKIERFVDRFACRYVECQHQHTTTRARNSPPDYMSGSVPDDTSNDQVAAQLASETRAELHPEGGGNGDQTAKNNLTMLSKDETFILTFAIIMLNTDLHSPSLKSTNRMSASQFVNNLRGVFKSRTIHESDLIEIYERVKANQITTSPDHLTHVMKVQRGLTTTNNFQKKEIPNLCVPYRRLVCFCRLFEVYDVIKKERPGQHQREIFLFNDILLVTKLARRARANAPQQYTYRQSIPLQGLYVQLSQSAHYNFGIKLCRRSNNETVIMFNARNELDQSRFVDDLNESIAEMDEMEHIRAHNIVDSIHSRQLDCLRRHAQMHDPENREKLGKKMTTTTMPTKTKASATNEKVAMAGGSDGSDQNNTSGSSYSSFNSDSANGAPMTALCGKPARMMCPAASAPMVVEPLDE
uniref:IQ motif and SEC7 domain-containing protein 1 n=1 Tax=Aceria tosichella TaxID=561515 RepID=A0A6G1SA16_9ACAR